MTHPTTTPSVSARCSDRTVRLSELTAANLHEVLGLCEEFLRTASPRVLTELASYLDTYHHPADRNWLIDMLGFNSMHLARKLDQLEDHQQLGGTR